MKDHRYERDAERRKSPDKKCAMCGDSIPARKTYCSACSDIRSQQRIKEHPSRAKRVR